MKGLPKILDFACFVLIWWQTDKKTRNPEAELQGPVHLDKTDNCLINKYLFCFGFLSVELDHNSINNISNYNKNDTVLVTSIYFDVINLD